MSDNEIIKALQLCASEHLGCEDDCPYANKKLTYSQCKLTLAKDILDLLSHQKEELDGKDHEIERLKNAYKQCAWERDIFVQDMIIELTENKKCRNF